MFAAAALAEDQSGDRAGLPDTIGGWEAAVPEDPNQPDISWVDSSYNYATDQAQTLSQWMDSFFGVPNYEVELPESLVRIDFISDWDDEDGLNNNIRLRGKLQLPMLSKRLNLVFSDESGDELDLDNRSNDERNLDTGVGLLYEVSEGKRSRFDLTMGINWNKLRPGVRYRYQGALGNAGNYRFTQRLQYETGEGAYATTQLELNRALGDNAIVRWANKGEYGEERDGVEWVTRLSLFQRHKVTKRRRKLGINYFGAVNGVTDPDSYVKNYRLGVLFRRQVYRPYLFLELEPAYNYRKRKPDEKRQFAWSVALRFQIALERDLIHKKNGSKRHGETTRVRAAGATRNTPDLVRSASPVRASPASLAAGDDL